MTWLTENLRILLADQLLIKYCIIKYLTLLQIQNNDGFEKHLVSMAYKFFDKTSAYGGGVKNENLSNQELAAELHEPIIKKIEKRKVDPFLLIIFGVRNIPICN